MASAKQRSATQRNAAVAYSIQQSHLSQVLCRLDEDRLTRAHVKMIPRIWGAGKKGEGRLSESPAQERVCGGDVVTTQHSVALMFSKHLLKPIGGFIGLTGGGSLLVAAAAPRMASSAILSCKSLNFGTLPLPCKNCNTS